MLRRLINSNIVTVDTSTLQKLPIAKTVKDQFVDNLSDLKILRSLVDKVYVNITTELTSDDYKGTVKYTTTAGDYLEKNVADCCQHVFNHQTHHRGQLTCILSQFGLDFGCTDLPIIVAN